MKHTNKTIPVLWIKAKKYRQKNKFFGGVKIKGMSKNVKICFFVQCQNIYKNYVIHGFSSQKLKIYLRKVQVVF